MQSTAETQQRYTCYFIATCERYDRKVVTDVNSEAVHKTTSPYTLLWYNHVNIARPKHWRLGVERIILN